MYNPKDMSFSSSHQLHIENESKIQRWRAIQTLMQKKSNFKDNTNDKKSNKSPSSQQMKKILPQQDKDLNIQGIEENQGQAQEGRLSLFSIYQKQKSLPPKKETPFRFSAIDQFQQTPRQLQSNENTSRQVDTNLESTFHNHGQIQMNGRSKSNTLSGFQQQKTIKEQSEAEQGLENTEQAVNDQDGVYFKDFESMQGEFQIYAEEFLALVGDPTYDPSERLLQNQLLMNQNLSTSGLLTKMNTGVFDCFKKIFLCFKQSEKSLNQKKTTEKNKRSEKDKQKSKTSYEKKEAFIISPDAQFRISWDILCMFMIIYAIIMVPFRMSFDQDDKFTNLIQVEAIFDYIFMIDIVLNFNTDFFSSFPYDAVVTAALGSQSNSNSDSDQNSSSSSSSSIGGLQKAQKIVRMLKFFRLMKVLKLLRVAKLKLILQKLIEYLKLSQSVLGVLGFLKLSSIVLAIAHWIACMWYLVGSSNTEDSWIIAQGIQDEDWDIKYITSIYWAITTMVTVGYGDITPQNREEKLFTIFIMLLACGIFAYTMNTMGQVLLEIESFSSEYKKEIQSVNRYLDSKKVKLELKIRIRKYLEYIYQSKQKNQIDETNLLSKLSSSLKNDLIHQINVKVINNCHLLTDIFDKTNHTQFLFQISINLQEKITIPEEIIFEQDSDSIEDDKSMYFIQDGEVEIFFQLYNKKTILKRLGAGSYFGELSFFTDLKRSASVQSVNFASLYHLKRSDFHKILQKFPNQREIFYEISDKIKNYNNYEPLDLVCFSCQKKGHIAANCTNLSFSFFKSRYIEKLLQNYKCEEIDFQRNTKSKFRTLKEVKKLEQKLEKFQYSPLVLSYIRFYNIDKQEIQDNPNLALNMTPGNFLADKVKQVILNKKNQDIQVQRREQQNSEHFLQIQYWKQVEEFDKVKIYDKYFKHNNIPQGETEEDHYFQQEYDKTTNKKQSSHHIPDQSNQNLILAPLIVSRRKYQEQCSLNIQKSMNEVKMHEAINKIEIDSCSSSSDSSINSKQSKNKQSIKISQQPEHNQNQSPVLNYHQELESKNQSFTNPQSEQELEVDKHKLFEMINTQLNGNIYFEDFNLNNNFNNFDYDKTPPILLNPEKQMISSKFKSQKKQFNQDQEDNQKQNITEERKLQQ